MSRTIVVSDRIFERLQAYAVPFVDQPEDVVARLLEYYKSKVPSPAQPERARLPLPPARPASPPVGARAPRERGVRVELGDRTLKATSVADLYEQALDYLLEAAPEPLSVLVPFSTSKERFLIAKKPAHPNGAAFVRPIHRRGLHMETHKDYRNAISHLGQLVEKCGLSFRYLGS